MPRQIHPTPFIIKPPADFAEKHHDLRRYAGALSTQFAGGVQKKEGMVAVVTDENLQAMGSGLWEALGVGAGFDKAREEAGASILPIIIETNEADEQALPWETLYHPTLCFLGKHAEFTLSRRMGAPKAAPAKPDKGPLRVLLFTSLPEDVDPEHGRLNVEEEQVQVQEALLPWLSQGLVELEMPDDGRFETLKALLHSFHPHVLFLSGHGAFHARGASGEPAYGEFLFEGETGNRHPVKEEAIAEALVGMGVQLVVLSACESGKAASDALTTGLTRRLSARGIPHVIGMRESIYDAAGIKFARALCDELARRERVDAALQAARIAIQTPFRDSGQVLRRETELTGAAEELSFGQWCLPMLIAPDPASPVVDWENMPAAPKPGRAVRAERLRFIGRRRELRRYKHRLLTGALTRLFISGAGGHGKTTLARKLVRELEERGYASFEWRADSSWRDFQQTLELALEDKAGRDYDRYAMRLQDQPEKLAGKCLELLSAQYDGKMVLLFDNLESIQDGKTHKITDPVADVWIKVACSDSDKTNLVVLGTSRWVIPDWQGEHLPLAGMNKGDFLRLAQTLRERGGMNPLLLTDRARMRRAYELLGHNPRGLEWLAAATLTMDAQEEGAFAEKLAQTRADLRQDMALEETLQRLDADALRLLRRAHAYAAPVPAEGLVKLGLDFDNPEAAFEALPAFSLLEITENAEYETLEYQVEPALLDYLRDKDLLDADPRVYAAAAGYLLWLMEHERKTYPHLALTIEALRRAGRDAEADRLTLDRLVGRFTLDGRYAELLTRWLPRICESQDDKTRAEALGQTGKLHLHLGNFKQALPYFEQSLTIRQQIGDKAGEGTTLNNISQIFKAQGDYETALSYLKQSLTIRQQIGDIKGESVTLNNISQILQAKGDYATALEYSQRDLAICQKIGDRAGMCVTLFNMGHMYARDKKIEEAAGMWVNAYLIARQIGYAELLKALASLAPQLGLPEGLEGWEMLAQRMQNSEGGRQSEGGGGLEQIKQFVQGLAQAHRSKSPEAQKYFENVSKMAVDPEMPPELRELGKVLREYMAGAKNPDLSKLSEELAGIVREELEAA